MTLTTELQDLFQDSLFLKTLMLINYKYLLFKVFETYEQSHNNDDIYF